MPVTIEKTFRFDAGHRALGFSNMKEETLHGHTWRLRLVVTATKPLNEHRTIFDTNELTRLVKPMIDAVDHSFIIWRQDPIYDQLHQLCSEAKIADKVYTVDFNPTVEGLVEYFYKLIKKQLPLENAELTTAHLAATETLSSTYSE